MAKRKPKTPRPKRTPPKSATDTAVKKQYRPWQFKPGQSGNPKGRPKGSRSGLKALLEAMEEQGIDIIALALARAKKSNSVLCKLLDKVVPTAKSIEIRDETKSQRSVVFEQSEEDDDRSAGE